MSICNMYIYSDFLKELIMDRFEWFKYLTLYQSTRSYINKEERNIYDCSAVYFNSEPRRLDMSLI